MTATALTTSKTIGEIYRTNATAHPDKLALVGTSRTLTFGALNERSNRLNAALATAGLQPGDRVAVVSRNRPELFEIFGIVKGGFIPVPLNWRLAPDELRAVLRDCRPAATIVEPDFESALDALDRDEVAPLHLTFATADDAGTYDAFVDSGANDEPTLVVDPDDVACIVYTSGTTGAPKGAQLTHRALIDNAQVLVGETDMLRPDDTVLAVMPIFHVGGMWYYAFPALALGCTTIVLAMFDPEAVLAAIAAHRITAAHLVPTMLGDVLSRDEVATRASTLRMVFYAGSPIPLATLQRALTTLTDCDFVQGYGSTEAAAIHVSQRGRPPPRVQRRRAPRALVVVWSCLRGNRDPDRRARGGRWSRRDRGAVAQHHAGVLGKPGGHAAPSSTTVGSTPATWVTSTPTATSTSSTARAT